jgi:hypothetical protein
MGPPSFGEKLNHLAVFFADGADQAELDLAKTLLGKYVEATPKSRERLELFTFGEFKSFLKSIGGKKDIGAKLRDMGEPMFRGRLEEYSAYVTLRLEDLAYASDQPKSACGATKTSLAHDI